MPGMRQSLKLLILSSAVGTVLSLAQCSCSHHSQSATAGSCGAVNRRDALRTFFVGSGVLLLPAPRAFATPVPRSGVSKLSDGTPFPLASFGLQIYDDEVAYKLTLTALEVGYRNFFASVLARNQRGFARAVRDSGVPQENLFICGSVVSNRAGGFHDAFKLTKRGCEQNMQAFAAGNIEYLDQIMLDYPGPDCDSIRGQWHAFEEMHSNKLVKTLSVSNFSLSQLDCILKDPKTTVKPVVNQLPFSVAFHPDSVQDNANRGVQVQAWAPLGGSIGGKFNSRIKGKCAEIGKKYGKSGAQVALRWIVQSGASFTTQSKKKEHFAEDLDIFDFELSEEDMIFLTALA